MKSPAPAFVQAKISEIWPEALVLYEDLVRTNSYTHNPSGVNANADRIARAFEPMGFKARRVKCAQPDTGDHLVLDTGGDGPVIACITHLDTVFPPEEEERNRFHWQPDGNRIYGPGTVDIKGGTVAIWMLMKTLSACAPEQFASARWVVLGNAAEEILSPDFAEVCRSVLPPSTRACLVFEADNEPERGFGILSSRKGRGMFRIRVAGRGSHAGSQYQTGANAIHQLSRVIDRVMALTDFSKEVTVNVGVVSGGVAVNRVPHEAEASLEVRAYSPEVYRLVRDAILGMTGDGEIRALDDGYPCRIEVELVAETPPWPENPGTEKLIAVWQKAAAQCNLPLSVGRRGGLSDGNRLWPHFPTLDALGPRGANDHSSERSPDGSKLPEYVDATSFVPKTLLNFFAVYSLITEPAE